MPDEHPDRYTPDDDLAIRSLLARIAQLADSGDVEHYVNCFTPEARWDMPGAPRRGRDDIRSGSLARRNSGEIGPGTRHLVTTIVVDFEAGRARARSYFQFFVDTAAEPKLRAIGQYDDEFVRTSEGWQVDHRRITFG